MKTKLISFVFILLIYLFPFRYAVLEPTSSNTVNLLCMIATVFGTLIFMGLTMTDGGAENKEKKEESSMSSSKLAA
jgi:hypothetical protein